MIRTSDPRLPRGSDRSCCDWAQANDRQRTQGTCVRRAWHRPARPSLGNQAARALRSQEAGCGSSSVSIDFSAARSKTDARSRPNAVHASFGLTRHVTSSGRRQARGGRKGGLPACEENGLAANDAVIFAKAEGDTMTADVKHLSAQVAIAAQTSVAFSHGLQQ